MEKKKGPKKYLITLRWFVESEEEVDDEKVLEILQHRKNGTPSCSTCPTRNAHGYAVLDHQDFMVNKPVYISTQELKDSDE
jgi:hypothetical protein